MIFLYTRQGTDCEYALSFTEHHSEREREGARVRRTNGRGAHFSSTAAQGNGNRNCFGLDRQSCWADESRVWVMASALCTRRTIGARYVVALFVSAVWRLIRVIENGKCQCQRTHVPS